MDKQFFLLHLTNCGVTGIICSTILSTLPHRTYISETITSVWNQSNNNQLMHSSFNIY